MSACHSYIVVVVLVLVLVDVVVDVLVDELVNTNPNQLFPLYRNQVLVDVL